MQRKIRLLANTRLSVLDFLFCGCLLLMHSQVMAQSSSSVQVDLASSSNLSLQASSVVVDVPSAAMVAPSVVAPSSATSESSAAATATIAASEMLASTAISSAGPVEQNYSSSFPAASASSSAGSLAASSQSSSIASVVAAADGASSAASSVEQSVATNNPGTEVLDSEAQPEPLSLSKFILDTEVKPNSSVRLTWSSETAVGGFSEATPILVVNGANPGKTLCLTGAVHGDELNGIEMIRRVMFDIDPAKLTGTIIGVPVANIMGFRRNSRYLPDRRDWNRYFPGNTHGSSASRLAHSFFTKIIMHCDALVDLHTGSFHRTNLPQLRADLADENVARLAQNFGVIAVLNGRGNPNSLRAAAVRAGIPAVTLEAGEPMAMQRDVVEEGVKAINTLLAKTGMYGKQQRWTRIAPVYYRSAWVRANQSGILFSKAELGQRVREDDVLGTVTDPITNARTTIKSPYNGRIIGMALDQVVLPGFAAYHIGIQTPEAILIEESQLNEGVPEEDEEDGDDAGIDPVDEMDEPENGVSKAQDRMADE